MSIFTALIFVNRKSKVQSRSLLGFSAVVAVLLSILSGFGLLFVAGTLHGGIALRATTDLDRDSLAMLVFDSTKT
jgi:hypothetical protein